MLSLVNDIDCSPHEKHFLLKFLQHYELTSKRLISRKALARILGIPLTRCYQSLSALSSLGAIEIKKERGNLDTHFVVESFVGKWGEWDARSKWQLHHEQIIQLLSAHPVTVESRQHQLTIPQRILLIALLEEADVFGLVSNMSLTTMQQRTGIEPRRIKQYLRSLVRSAYIRSYTREGSHENNAECFTGIYLLDPQHPNYKLRMEKPKEVVFFNIQPVLDPEDLNFIFTLRRRLIDDTRIFTTARSPSGSGQSKGQKQKKIVPSYRAWLNLNWQYLNIVSKTLNKHWTSLSTGSEAPVRKDINHWLKDFPLEITVRATSESDHCEHGGEDQKTDTLSAISIEIVDFALRLAASIQAILQTEVIGDDNPTGLTFNISPCRMQQNWTAFTVEILFAVASERPASGESSAITLSYDTEECVFRQHKISNPRLLRSLGARGAPENKPRLPDFQRGRFRKS